MTNPRTAAAFALASLMVAASMGCADEVLVTPIPCETPAWRSAFDLSDSVRSHSGAVVADDGNHMLVVWDESVRNTDEMRLFTAQLDSQTGALVVPRTELRQVVGLDGFEVVAGNDGFLVFVFSQGDVSVIAIDEDGVASGESSPGGGELGVVVADDDGISVVAFGLDVIRLDRAGAFVSRTPGQTNFSCTAAVTTTPGRLLAWCFHVDTREGALFEMANDGTDVSRVDHDFIGDATGRLVVVGDVVVAAFAANGGDVMAVVFDAAGNVVKDPVVIGQVVDGADLLGEDICTGTCNGLSLAASGDVAVVGFESRMRNVSFHDKLSFVTLTVTAEADAVSIEAGRPSLRVGHAHTVAAAGRGRVVSWLDESGNRIVPWELPPQVLLVERTCAGR